MISSEASLKNSREVEMEPYVSRAIEMFTGAGSAIWSVSHGQEVGRGRLAADT